MLNHSNDDLIEELPPMGGLFDESQIRRIDVEELSCQFLSMAPQEATHGRAEVDNKEILPMIGEEA